MMEDLEMVYEPLPGEDVVRFLSDNVININFARTGVSTWHPVNYLLKNRRGELLGGLLGNIWGGWLHVTYLWITEPLRGQGLGSRLMDAAEAKALHLVNEIVPQAMVLERAIAIAERASGYNASVIRLGRDLYYNMRNMSGAQALEESGFALIAALGADDEAR